MSQTERESNHEDRQDARGSIPERQFRESITALNSVTQTLSQASSLKTMCRRAIGLGREMLGFDRLGLWLVENDDLTKIFGTFGVGESGALRDEWRHEVSVSADSVVGRLLRGKMLSHYVADTPLWNDRNEMVARGEQAVAPMWDGESIIGVLSTDNLLERKPIDGYRCELLSLFASSMGYLVSLKRAEQQRRELVQKVQQTQKLESLGVMAGGIAHEFNNLLVGVLGNADLALAETGKDSPIKDCLEDIRECALRAADLTSQMLAYSGHGRFVIEPVDVNGVVRALDSLIEAASRGRAVAKYDLVASLPHIMADEAQIRQLVINLVTNACESFVNWSGCVTIRTNVVTLTPEELEAFTHCATAEEGRYAVLEVEDSGCGIPESALESVFDPFFTTKFTGRGLGLAAVLGIVMSHNGAINVHSVEGEGSRLSVYFPLGERRADAARGAEGTPDAGESRSGSAVLIVDDEDNVRQVLKRLLVKNGYPVYEAENGGEAIETLAAHGDEIALVVLDYAMPQLNGEEALWPIREISPDLPVLITSGYSEKEVMARFADCELAGFIQKPFIVEDVMARIVGLIG